MLVEDSHRYHSISHGWATDNPRDWEDAIAPLAKGERGRAFKAISPGMLPPLGIIFGLFVAFTGRFIHGNEVSPGNLCREPAAVA
jgi:hypothetical protein